VSNIVPAAITQVDAAVPGGFTGFLPLRALAVTGTHRFVLILVGSATVDMSRSVSYGAPLTPQGLMNAANAIRSFQILVALAAIAAIPAAPQQKELGWRHLSSARGDLPVPNAGKEQTSLTVADFCHDGRPGFVVTERTAPDSVVLYRPAGSSYKRIVIEPKPLHIEAGGVALDVDGDGNLDFIAGGDWQNNNIWWWRNPYPDMDRPWQRFLIKHSAGNKHHDQRAGDFDGSGRPQIVFWNQDSHGLFIARAPNDPVRSGLWPITAIYRYSSDSQPEQLGKSPDWKGINEHEGLAVIDVDGDGKPDIVGGGRWFRNLTKRPGEYKFEENIIDARYAFSRAAAGRLINGSPRPQVVFVVGDGDGPLLWYEWVKGTWVAHKIADIHFGHSLQLADFDGDGNLDIFCAEQRLDGANPQAKAYIFFGDGKGNFTPSVVAEALDFHEAKAADLNGDGRIDIVSKPYNFGSPRLDIFLNEGLKGRSR